MSDTPKPAPPLDTSAAAGAVVHQLPERLAAALGGRLYRLAGLLFLLAILFFYMEAILRVMLLGFVGAILGIAFNTVVKRLPLSRGLATGAVALATLGAIVAAFWFLISMMVDQIRELIQDLPNIVTLLEGWEEWLQDTTGMEIEILGETGQQILDTVMGGVGGGAVLAGAFGLLEMVAIAVLVLMGAFFVVAKPNERLLTPFMRAVPREKRPAWHRMFKLLGERLSGWLWGTLVSMVIIGTMTTIVFYILGTPYPLALGVFVGLADIIPLIGPWIGGLVAVIITLFHDPMLAIWVAVAVIAIQELEGNLIRPMVMSGAANLHPFVTLLALILFGSMFGLLGAILSLPIVLALGTAIQVLWVEETLEAGDDEIEPVVET
jgi:putative permease